MFYQGPTINPGVEATIACSGKLMLDVSRPIDDCLAEVLEPLYQPKTPAAMKKLIEVFSKPEWAYFSQWDEKRILEHDKIPAPGELHLGPLFGDSPGGATYLSEPFLDRAGRKAFREAMLSVYDLVASCESDLPDTQRVGRLKQCIVNTIADIETLQLGKGES
jgi:hypothetical protein